MGWVSLRLWSFSPGKVVRPGCLLWNNPAPPLILLPLAHDYLHWYAPVIFDRFMQELFVDCVVKSAAKIDQKYSPFSFSSAHGSCWVLHGRHLHVMAGVCEGLGGREVRAGQGVRTGLNG